MRALHSDENGVLGHWSVIGPGQNKKIPYYSLIGSNILLSKSSAYPRLLLGLPRADRCSSLKQLSFQHFLIQTMPFIFRAHLGYNTKALLKALD